MVTTLIKNLARLPVFFSLCGLLPLVGCSFGDNHSDLRSYVDEVKARPQGAIEPLPPLRTYDAYIYNVTAMRSPFDAPIEVKEIVQSTDPKVKPDFGREKEYLETFALDSLSMVGTLQKEGRFWALVKDGVGGINRVTLGNYLGKDHGKIVSASPTQIDLIEIVSDGLGGWLQRPRTLKLSEKE
jgi:type IV pilus assembly protein PilP